MNEYLPTVNFEKVQSTSARKTLEGITEDGIQWQAESFEVELQPKYIKHHCRVKIVGKEVASFSVYKGLAEAGRLATILLRHELRLHRQAGHKDSSW